MERHSASRSVAIGAETGADMSNAQRPSIATGMNDLRSAIAHDPRRGIMRPWISARVVDGVHGAAEFEQYGRGFRFDCDEAHERGGSEAGPSPMRYFLASIAFCAQGWIAKSLLERGVPARVGGVDVRTILDMGGELGLPGTTVHPPWVVVDIRIEDARDADTDALVLAVQYGVEHCPITSLVLQAVPVHLMVRTDEGIVHDDRSTDVTQADSTPVSR
jgi:uncharacterized OsmC-like protein